MDICEMSIDSTCEPARCQRGVGKSASQLSAELALTMELLRQAKPFVGRCASAQAQELSDKITRHFASIFSEEKKS